MNNKEIRVRFAPSPTGPLHIGGVRTALYNYLFAKKHGGRIILRIEDTDQHRYVEGAEDYIIESLNWCGIHFDEDIKKGGASGPYRQSERKTIYRQYAEQLVQSGHAYYAFDTEAELEVMRSRTNPTEANASQYGPATRMNMKNALALTEEEVQQKLNNGEPHVIRIKIPEKEVILVNDLIRGEVLVQSSNLDDKVLFKSDGWPTYHLANIVDDHLMGITHVIRGEEWLPSAPLHVLLYRYLGWEDTMPLFAHLPLLLKPDGPGKLSKRDGDRLGFPVFPLEWDDPATHEISSGYRESGYLPEAFINMLALLGWNPGTEQELFTMEQLIADFSLDRVGKHGSKFDPEKAKWFNHQYIQRMSDGELAEVLRNSVLSSRYSALGTRNLEDQRKIENVCALIKERVVLLPDLWKNAWFFFEAPESYDEQVFQKIWKPETTGLVKSFADEVALLQEWTKESIHDLVEGFIVRKQIKMGQLMTPLRLLVVGSNQGPGMMDILHLLGKEEAVARMERGVERLSNKNFMKEAFHEAFHGIRNNHGGPFGAVIVKDDVIIGKGYNMVISRKDPTAHAEIVAIRQACNNINSFDLSGSVLFTTCEPCPMCFSAVYWANIKEVIFSLSRHDAELMGFKDNHIYEELSKDISERKIRFTKMDHSSVKILMEEWNLKPDKFLY